MSEGRLGRSSILLAAIALILGACDSSSTSTTTATSEVTFDATSTTRVTTLRSSTTTTVARPRTSTSTTTTTTPGTTSTTLSGQPGTPPETPPVNVEGALGVVGCSNTDQAVEGYHEVSDLDLLTPGGLGGGSISPWGDPTDPDYSTYWSLYDDRRPAGGYAGTWVQLCIRTAEHQGVFDDAEKAWVTHIVEQVHARDPGITVWVSPVNFYADGVVCEAVGVDGPAIAAETSDWAASALGDVSRGPDLGPLTQSDLGARDNCHPGGSGRLLLGSQLAAFFD